MIYTSQAQIVLDKGTTQTITVQTYETYRLEFNARNDNYEPIPEYNMAFLRATVNYLHARLQYEGYLFLNEAFMALGFERTPAGQVTGWHVGNQTYVDIDIEWVPGSQDIWVILKVPSKTIVNDI